MDVHKEDEAHLLEEEKEYFKTHEVVKGHVAPQDPLHDIDSKKTVKLLIAWTVALFLGIWVMSQLFHFMARGERYRKVAENLGVSGPIGDDVLRLRAQEEKELKGEDGYLSIDEAMEELLKR